LEKVIGGLDEQVQQMLAEAARRDAAEDAAERDRSDSVGPLELGNRSERLAKLKAAKQRLEAEAAEAQRIQDQRRADYQTATGGKGGPPGVKPPKRGGSRNGKTNLTDSDSRIMHTRDGFRQGFNGQAVVTSDQVIVAAEVVPDNTDFQAFHPMLGGGPRQPGRGRGGRSDSCGGGRCRLFQQAEPDSVRCGGQ
jgi:hypothetical protein